MAVSRKHHWILGVSKKLRSPVFVNEIIYTGPNDDARLAEHNIKRDSSKLAGGCRGLNFIRSEIWN